MGASGGAPRGPGAEAQAQASAPSFEAVNIPGYEKTGFGIDGSLK